MADSVSNFTIASYNMHGFAQGIAELDCFCNERKYDVIFLQEHWLSINSISKRFACFMKDYYIYIAPQRWRVN